MWKNEGIVKYVEELENALVLALNDNTTTPRFGGMNCRTMDEEYFYDRLYGIPWRFEFLILSSDGSEYPLSSDAYVQCYPQEDGGMQIYVTAEIRKDKSNARFNKIDSSCVISASLFVGKEENLFSLYKDKFNRRCSGKARQSLTSSNPVVTEDGAIWRFAYVPKNEDDDEDDDVNDRNLKDKLILKSVSFNLPAASNGYIFNSAYHVIFYLT